MFKKSNLKIHKRSNFILVKPLISSFLFISIISLTCNNVLAKDSETEKYFEISLGKSILYKYTDPIARISVGDPTVADVLVMNPKQIYLLGKKVGSTNVMLWHSSGELSTIDLSVNTDVKSLQNLLTQLMSNEKNIVATAAGESLILTGQVSDGLKVQQAVQIAQEFSGKKVLNMMTTEDLPQVMIEVKIAELDKSLADDLGIQLQGSNFSFNMLSGAGALGFSSTLSKTSGSTTTWLQAQINSGLVKILAEPNIMAISGQDGEFLSGGIVYLPVPQSNTGSTGSVITLQPQNYGVGVKFTPTVLSEGRINLKVSPQVSQVQTSGISVSAGGSTTVFPSITTRQASTTVQLYDGQSFAIGGLINNNVTEIISAFPGLANLPIIGVLFRSTSFKEDRSELLIVITAHIVKAVSNKISLPTEKFSLPTQSDLFMNGQLESKKIKSLNEVISK